MSINKKKLFKPGFTLLELLVVIAILGILSTIGIGSFMSSQAKSRDARRKGDLHTISQALEMYSNDHGGMYPLSHDPNVSEAIKGVPYGCGTSTNEACSWGDIFGNSNVLYMSALPQAVNGYGEYYYYSADGGSYTLYAVLENTLDKEVAIDGYYDANGDGSLDDCGGESCNYGIHSTNTSLPTPTLPPPAP